MVVSVKPISLGLSCQTFMRKPGVMKSKTGSDRKPLQQGTELQDEKKQLHNKLDKLSRPQGKELKR